VDIDGVTKEAPVPREVPPEDAAYQLMVPPDETAPNVTVPVPHLDPGVVEVIFKTSNDATTFSNAAR